MSSNSVLPVVFLIDSAEGVGKSTIVTSLIKESFVAHVRGPSYSQIFLNVKHKSRYNT